MQVHSKHSKTWPLEQCHNIQVTDKMWNIPVIAPSHVNLLLESYFVHHASGVSSQLYN